MITIKPLKYSHVLRLTIAGAVGLCLVAAEYPGSTEAFCATRGNATPDVLASKPEIISLPDKDFRKFTEKRQQYYVPLFGERAARTYMKRDSEADERHTLLQVQSPNGRMNLTPKTVTANWPVNATGETWNKWHRPSIEQAATMLPYFPEITSIWLDHTTMPDALWRQTVQLKHLTMVRSHSKQELAFSDEAMRLIAQQSNLTLLELGRCRISEKGFRYLKNLRNLESISFGGDVTPEAFVTLAKLPKIKTIIAGPFGQNSFAEPIDDETQRAIASLDGRLKFFAVAEYSYQDVHISLARPLMRMKSLEGLWLYGVVGPLKVSDFEPLLDMEKLRCFNMDRVTKDAKDVTPPERDEINGIIHEVLDIVEERVEAVVVKSRRAQPEASP
jgi:hypothetical protein